MDNKLNIFWIEDNTIINRSIPNADGLEFPDLIETDLINYYIFQHPYEVKDYLTCLHLLLGQGVDKSTLHYAIPDLIFFDYKLSDNFELQAESLKYNIPAHHSFLLKHNVSRAMKEKNTFLKSVELFPERQDVINGTYNSEEFEKDIHSANIADDEFGLFSAVTILKEFNDYVSIGIPSTINKSDPVSKSISANYFEWLNNVEIMEGLSDAVNSEKNWSNFLAHGLPIFRCKLIDSISQGIILPDYDVLFTMLNSNDVLSSNLKFKSSFGIRNIKIASLFVDQLNSTSEAKARDWIETKVVPSMINVMGVSKSVVDIAIQKYSKIYSKFSDHFNDRIILSYLSSKLEEKIELEKKLISSISAADRVIIQNSINLIEQFLNDYSSSFADLTSKFKVQNEKITNIDLLCDISTEYSAYNKNDNFPLAESRLVVLLLVTRLWIDYHLTNENNPLIPLNREDYFNVMNPIINSNLGLTLYMHKGFRSKTQDQYLDKFQKSFVKRSLNMKPSDFWSFTWISFGEKSLVKSYFLEKIDKLIKLPEWLK